MECEALDFSSKLTSLFRQTKFDENIFLYEIIYKLLSDNNSWDKWARQTSFSHIPNGTSFFKLTKKTKKEFHVKV